jgi:hypothetical protein
LFLSTLPENPSLVPYGLTRDIFGANWRCGRNISWHNGSAVMA